MPGDALDLTLPCHSPLGRAAFVAARPLLSQALGLGALRRIHQAARRNSSRPFAGAVLEALDIAVDVAPEDLMHIPATGPVIVVANHPRGLADGLIVADVVGRIRPDARLIANLLLARVPELAGSCFFVDPFGGPEAAARSRAGLRAAHLWLRRGGAVVLFPAGAVSPSCDRHGPVDSTWHSTLGRLAAPTGAAIVPVHLAGRNSALFYRAGRLHERLRTSLLPRELLRQRGETARVRIGPALAPAAGRAMDPAAVTSAARTAVDALARRPREAEPPARPQLAAEIAALPADARLLTHGQFAVYIAAAREIPRVLQEIGRLRQVTYQAAGEGAGRTIDLDAFDARYLHLFSWDHGRQQVVGAYRLGRTDEIAARYGAAGLYTRTLFRYDEAFLDRLGPALELGRSFVQADYQRQHSALLLLWKGIGVFLARHPRYRVLFGPVSISRQYSDLSRSLLRTYLEDRHFDPALAALVESCHPLARMPEPVAFAFSETIDDIQRRIRALEPDGKGIPVLVRQYLQLDARVLGFNLDPAFSDVVDALMMVDLDEVKPALLRRILGPATADRIAPASGARSTAA